MTTQQILNLLDEKNQNLPSVSIQSDFKGAEIIAVPVLEGEEKTLEKVFGFLKKEKLSGKKNEKKRLIEKGQEFMFVGIGKKEELTYRGLRRYAGSAYMAMTSCKPKKIAFYCNAEWVEPMAVGLHVAALNAGSLKSKPKKEPVPEVVLFHPDFKKSKKTAEKNLKTGLAIASGKNLMRLLGSLPPNVLNTDVYANVILGLAKKWKVKCERISQQKLKNYNLLNAVSAGSKYNSELLVFTLNPKKGKTKTAAALIGKGLCYDSGGLQGKQNFMKFMKEDMAGSASVLGTLQTLNKGGLDLKETTYFIMPLAENMMGQAAMRADDIYTAGDGQTVEIIHTDAEGRLALADAICYAKNNFKSIKKFYTIATLTGACIIALGEHYTGVVCNKPELRCEVEKLGKLTGDHMHAGPWDMDYDDNNSPNADMANLGEADREAGWIKAGLFLYRFVPKAKKEAEQADFCHFDIAASIDMHETGKAWRQKGLSSGIGVGILSKLLTK